MPALAQGLFDPVVQVNDKVVTQYELDQRIKFMEMVRAPGDLPKQALDALINERLEIETATRMGIKLTPEDIAAGETEFAQRANITREDFVKTLEQGGVAAQSFRDFVTAGLLWRQVVRQRYASRVTITDDEVDRALSDTAPRTTGIKVLFSEIILPMPPDNPQAQIEAQDRADEIRTYTTIEQFSQAARDYSASPSAQQGGRLGWMELAKMQPQLVQILMGLKPGEVSEPFPIPNGLALFQMRAIDDHLAPLPADAMVDYAIYLIPGGQSPEARAEATREITKADTCDDLQVDGHHAGRQVLREKKPMSQIPRDVALELARLDDGETSTALSNGGNLELLMLCSRELPLPQDITREDVRNRLQNQRIQTFADGYLAELRANAILRFP